jgi:hypothetical protein
MNYQLQNSVLNADSQRGLVLQNQFASVKGCRNVWRRTAKAELQRQYKDALKETTRLATARQQTEKSKP